MQPMLAGILSEIIHDFNLFSVYSNFLIHLNIYYSCKYF